MFASKLLVGCGCAFVCIAATASQAAVLFSEDFENYQMNSSDTNQGIPLLSEGANQLWYGGRFGTPDGGGINDDVSIRYNPDSFPAQKHYARMEDDAGILFHLNTTGYTNVTLSFEWMTHLTESNDKFTVGFYTSDIDFVNDSFDGPDDNLLHKFNDDGPAWGSWTQLLSSNSASSFTNASFALPSNTTHVWVAFWLNDGEGDYGKLDNIKVTGDLIPAPGALATLAIGLVGMGRRRRS